MLSLPEIYMSIARRAARIVPAGLCCVLAIPALAAPAASNASAPTQIEMANVLFRYSPSLSVQIVRLEGSLLPTPGHPIASFNDATSFEVATNAAEMRMSGDQISALMNDWLLRSPKAQLKNVRVSIEGQNLHIRGTMKKGIHIGFDALADAGITSDNRIRFSVRKVKAVGIPVKGLMDSFGLEMDNLVSQKGLNGMSVDKDSFLIDPRTAFPAPHIRGKLAGVRVAGGVLVITFGSGMPHGAHAPARNYMAMRGGSLQYGRDTMANADLTMIDSTPADLFDFYLHDYWCQIVAGTIKATPGQGWIVHVVDYAKLPRGTCKSGAPEGH
jgi:hypothetical protein